MKIEQDREGAVDHFGIFVVLVLANILSLWFQWIALVECGMWLMCLVAAMLEARQEDEDGE